jgi:hypothetical protein
MTADELTAFQDTARMKQLYWHAERREYVRQAADILPGLSPWPVRKPNAWKSKPAPGTIDDEAAD